MDVSIEVLCSRSYISSSVDRRIVYIRSHTILAIAHTLEIDIRYLINWARIDGRSFIYETDGLRVTYNDEEAIARYETTEDGLKRIRGRGTYSKKQQLPERVSYLREAPRFYYSDGFVVETFGELGYPYHIFECSREVVPLHYKIPKPITYERVDGASVEKTIIDHKASLVVRERIYYLLPAERDVCLTISVHDNRLSFKLTGQRYLFPMSCRDTWALLSRHFNCANIKVITDEMTYPPSVFMKRDVYRRFLADVTAMFEPFAISK